LESKLVALILPEVADEILGGKNAYKKYLNSISKNLKPNSFEVRNTYAATKIKRKTGEILGKNVIGIIEGSDPVLKNECVVYIAHYDHLGLNKHGEVYNGADDNGSGTVVLLELAEAFAKLNPIPLRSIVFLWVTGEEVGLLGSKYYTQNPVFPLEKTVACINLDMVGRVYEPRDSIWKKSPKMVKDFDGVYTLVSNFSPQLKMLTDGACNKLGLIPDYSLPDNFFHSSDHHFFHINGVPILNLATGYHADYHKTSDEISKINFEKMKRIADLAFIVGQKMANNNFK
jgi:Zn-dependent M28 family amino/carboxypeptidase